MTETIACPECGQLHQFCGLADGRTARCNAILTGLVQFGTLARVDANAGSLSFAAVVVLTMMFAARTLDGHLIRDISRHEDQQR